MFPACVSFVLLITARPIAVHAANPSMSRVKVVNFITVIELSFEKCSFLRIIASILIAAFYFGKLPYTIRHHSFSSIPFVAIIRKDKPKRAFFS